MVLPCVLAMNYAAFDAMWALYVGLNASQQGFIDIGESIETFDYSKTNMAQILFNNTISSSFYGTRVSRARVQSSFGHEAYDKK